jgi:hypothetical protein
MMTVKTVQLKVLFWSLAVLLIAEGIALVLLAKTGHLPMMILGCTRLVEAFLILLIVSICGEGMSSLGLTRDQIPKGLRQGLLWSAIFGLCALLVFFVLKAMHIDALGLIKTDLPLPVQELVLFFVVGGLIAPVAEEIFFRGIIYGFLRRWGVLVAVFGTTVVFGAAHWIGTGVLVTQIVGGIVFALAYEKSGSLIAPVTIHVFGNVAIFTLSLV